MSTTVQKWGNSLGVRLPVAVMKSARLHQGSRVEIYAQSDVVLIKPVVEVRRKSLKELLKGITKNNRHELVDWGPPVGKEVW